MPEDKLSADDDPCKCFSAFGISCRRHFIINSHERFQQEPYECLAKLLLLCWVLSRKCCGAVQRVPQSMAVLTDVYSHKCKLLTLSETHTVVQDTFKQRVQKTQPDSVTRQRQLWEAALPEEILSAASTDSESSSSQATDSSSSHSSQSDSSTSSSSQPTRSQPGDSHSLETAKQATAKVQLSCMHQQGSKLEVLGHSMQPKASMQTEARKKRRHKRTKKRKASTQAQKQGLGCT